MTLRSLILLMALVLAACGADPAPAASAASKAKPKVAATTEPAAATEVAETVEYAYSPVGKRDPFRSLLDDEVARPEDTGASHPNCGALCRWEIEQLKLVAVVSGISNPLGMVEDPSGVGHVVRRGTFIGKRNGKVTQIRAGEVVVTEIFKDQMGKPHVNPVIIKLPAEEKARQDDQNLLGLEVAE